VCWDWLYRRNFCKSSWSREGERERKKAIKELQTLKCNYTRFMSRYRFLWYQVLMCVKEKILWIQLHNQSMANKWMREREEKSKWYQSMPLSCNCLIWGLLDEFLPPLWFAFNDSLNMIDRDFKHELIWEFDMWWRRGGIKIPSDILWQNVNVFTQATILFKKSHPQNKSDKNSSLNKRLFTSTFSLYRKVW
jgi:hypothetical protein